MTKIYLISNNNFMDNSIIYKDYIDFDDSRKYRPLDVNGEKSAMLVAKKKILASVNHIYCSSYFSAIDSAKYLSDKLGIDIIVDRSFDDRIVGDLSDKKLNLRSMQEHDFNYKLVGGESINDVKNRIKLRLKEIISENKDEEIAIFTHNISIIALISIWCEKEYNFEGKLMLNYDEKVIIDGMKNDYSIIELEFNENNLIGIKKTN